jgi:hypothetical protein
VCEKSLEMRHFGVLPYPEEGELAHSWAPGGGRDGRVFAVFRQDEDPHR